MLVAIHQIQLAHLLDFLYRGKAGMEFHNRLRQWHVDALNQVHGQIHEYKLGNCFHQVQDFGLLSRRSMPY
ncbi:hypothetical protein EV14_1061 [Prochlorococcus sp. MIT 0703]|nr:hypothetical protein EV14_1061 [Prochlorococcus sp. MIT 0703]